MSGECARMPQERPQHLGGPQERTAEQQRHLADRCARLGRLCGRCHQPYGKHSAGMLRCPGAARSELGSHWMERGSVDAPAPPVVG